MKTPLTDAKMYYPSGTAVVPVRFAQELERDLRFLLLRLYVAWENDPWSFGPESAGVMEKWQPEIEKMIKENRMTPCDKCGGNTANPEFPDGLILCDDCRDQWEMAHAEHMRDMKENR